MEKANYPGDPGGYRKKRRRVRTKGKCRMICNRDPVCCHWVHYGPHRGNQTKFNILLYINHNLVKRGKQRWGRNVCFLKKEKSVFVQRNPRQVNNGPVFAGSLNCGGPPVPVPVPSPTTLTSASPTSASPTSTTSTSPRPTPPLSE